MQDVICKFDLRGFKTIKAKWETCKRQPDANSLILVIWHLATGSQMSIRFEAVIENTKRIGNRQTATSCLFVNPGGLAIGSQKQIRYERVYTIKAESATGKRQPDANLQILVNWQLVTGCQMPIRFEAVIEKTDE